MKMNIKAIISIATLLLLASAAAAEPVVLSVDKGLVYIDLGSKHGVGFGTELELVREVVVTDPVTRATLRDKFALGALVVTKAGAEVCEARPSAALAGRVRVGDEIRIASDARRFIDPWAQRVMESRTPSGGSTPIAVGPGADRATAARSVEEAEAARAAWQATLGKPPADRAAVWKEFVAKRPGSPYAPAIKTEIASLEAQAQTLARAAEAAAKPVPQLDRRRALAQALVELRGDLAPTPLWAAAPSRVAAGRAVELTFVVREELKGAVWLFVRTGGDGNFRRIELVPDGDAYLRGTIPADLVSGSGLEWYVEIGEGQRGLGGREAPLTIAVDADVSEPPPAVGRTSITTSLDYVDFDGGLSKGHDQYYQAELDFTYRFIKPVHAMRIGFGTLSGKGGPKDVIDADTSGQCMDEGGNFRCRAVDYTYVYTEMEVRPSRFVALMLRPLAGLLTTDRTPRGGSGARCRDTQEIDDCSFLTRVGFRARARFGDERSTNLVLGLGVTPEVGTLFEAAYNFTARREIPVHLAVQVTDLPVTTDFGVRLVADVGYRGRSWVYPSARLSYQARDIDHSGFSGGLGLNFDW